MTKIQGVPFRADFYPEQLIFVMYTLVSIAILFLLCSVGLIAVSVVMTAMVFAGMPGGVLYEVGLRKGRADFQYAGLIAAVVGQGFVVCTYAVFTVSVLRAFAGINPDLPTWPLWIGALYQTTMVSLKPMPKPSEAKGAQQLALGYVFAMSIICFLVMAFFPGILSGVFGWVPLFSQG